MMQEPICVRATNFTNGGPAPAAPPLDPRSRPQTLGPRPLTLDPRPLTLDPRPCGCEFVRCLLLSYSRPASVCVASIASVCVAFIASSCRTKSAVKIGCLYLQVKLTVAAKEEKAGSMPSVPGGNTVPSRIANW